MLKQGQQGINISRLNVILNSDNKIKFIETFFFLLLILLKVIGFVIFPIVHVNVKQLDKDNVLNHVLMIVIVEVDIDHVYVIMIVECHVLNEVNSLLFFDEIILFVIKVLFVHF
jgi:hypothetical protein